jgi:CheY-like chemotaxis protein
VRAEAKGLELVTRIDPDLPLEMMGDPNRVWQILVNLVGNAIKLTEEGEVVVRARTGELEPAENQPALIIEVTDTGVGITTEDQERIFERFVQADSSTARRYGGTGLGLNIARALVELMGGTIEIESPNGRGSTFRVILPCAPTTGICDRESFEGALRNLRVLVIASNPESRRALVEMIDAAGAATGASGSITPALTEHASGAWDVIVTDAPRTNMESVELVELAQTQASNPAAVICLAGLGLSSAANQLRSLDSVEYLLKPVKQARLITAILAGATGLPPLGREYHPPGPQVGGQPAQTASRVLLVDDIQDNWNLAARILAAAGYEVDLAENGAVAVDKARQFRYDLILMDIDMPVMDGFAATQEIRALELREGREAMPIVALTAHAAEGFREQCLEKGMDDLITKPIKRQALLQKVAEWVDQTPVILIADDAPENAVIVRKYMEAVPARLLFASNGKEAETLFRRQRVSLILLDMDMPVQDGYETARAVRRMPEGRNVPIVALTGYSGPHERRKCIEAGCTEHMTKPLRRGALVRIVRNLLEHEISTHDMAVPTPVLERLSVRQQDSELEHSAFSRVKGDLQRIRRHVGQTRFNEAAVYAGLVEDEVVNINSPGVVDLARELVTAISQENSVSAIHWSDRLLETLRESERLRVLISTGLLDAPVQQSFDNFTRLASRMLKVPIALVSLVDEHRQFFLSQCGLEASVAEARETPLSHSFCKYVVAAGEELVVDDARDHPLVKRNLAIPDLGVIAYLGFPILHRGHIMGSFCVIDNKARKWTPDEIENVKDFAHLVSREIELQRHEAMLSGQSGMLHDANSIRSGHSEDEESFPVPTSLINTFITTRLNDIRQAREHLRSERYKDIASLGHQLKGSSAMLGFPEIGELGAALERAAREADRDAAEETLNQLEDALTARG